MTGSKEEWYRQLPSVDEMLRHPAVVEVCKDIPRSLVADRARKVIDMLRQAIDQASTKELESKAVTHDKIARLVVEASVHSVKPSLVPVINATGVILHTNLGRSPLPPEAATEIAALAGGYSNLEMDLDSGLRSSRHDHVAELIRMVTGAEAAMAVNNNAAAVLLAMAALGADKEVIVSRGELVEIGGSFRIPDVMRQSGAILREVGTTNKTRISDYSAAISEQSGMLLKVHTSNYRVVGFTGAAGLEELVALGKEAGLPVVEDLGSGALFDASALGLEEEPSVRGSISAGVDLVTFSADKLLCGPQAGIIAGKARLVDLLAKHPLARALRVDKLTLAALHATLIYWADETRWKTLPIMSMIFADKDKAAARAGSVMKALEKAVGPDVELTLIDTVGKVGGGAMPTQELPGAAIAIRTSRMEARVLARKLRIGDPPVVARLEDDALLVDIRTVLPEQTEPLVRAITKALQQPSG